MGEMIEGQRVALIVGGGSGIGEATAHRLKTAGYALAIADLIPERAEAAANAFAAAGVPSLAITADVADEGQTHAMVEAVMNRFGRIDFLLNCAGGSKVTPLEEMTLEAWSTVIAANLTSLFLTSREVLPAMKQQRRGSIVGISSIFGWGVKNRAHYAAAKAGIVGFVRSLALEVAAEGIRVNAVAPGLIGTERVIGNTSPAGIAEREAIIPMHRIGQPGEVADVIAFLASDAASYVTGQVIHINGGELLA